MNIFICKVCGHIAFELVPSNCPVCWAPKEQFVSSNKIFEESEAKSKEAAVKHIPAVTINKKCGLIPEQPCIDIVVRIGQTLHPMEQAHYIKFIDCYVDNNFVSRKMLTTGVFPAAVFHLKMLGKKVTIVEQCNLHGYWKTEAEL